MIVYTAAWTQGSSLHHPCTGWWGLEPIPVVSGQEPGPHQFISGNTHAHPTHPEGQLRISNQANVHVVGV